MGNYLEQDHAKVTEKGLLYQLKARNLKDITECINTVVADYSDVVCLDYNQFEDIFCSLLDDPEPFFLLIQNIHNPCGTVDLYESLAGFVIFSGERFEQKASFIFKMFDFDSSGDLDMKELILTLQAASRSLCKFVNIEPPSTKHMEEIAKAIFSSIDQDHNRKISEKEFLFWIEHNQDLQNFLVRYAQTQSYHGMKKRFEKIFVSLDLLFSRACTDLGQEFVENVELKKVMKEHGKPYIKDEDLDFLTGLLDANTVAHAEELNKTKLSTDGVISRKVFNIVMKAWAAYVAADVNNDGHLVAHELYTILRIYENQEPSESRVHNDMVEMDKNKNGLIEKVEWMNNFCSPAKNGKMMFRSNLKSLFEKYDSDNSGALSVTEVKSILMESFRDYSKKTKNNEMKGLLDGMVESLATVVFNKLDQDHNGSIEWTEFKEFVEVSVLRIKEMKQFLDLHMEELAR